MNEPIRVPQAVLDGLERVRQEGRFNMFDYHGVMTRADQLEEYDTVVWMAENRERYVRGIFAGFKAK